MIIKIIQISAGVLIGGIGGFLFYKYVGCVSGTCPITSNPFFSSLYGSIFGLLIAIAL